MLIAAAVASFAALAYEALLVRFFALSQWNHLTFLVLGVALLGFSASGVVLAALVSRRPPASAMLRRPSSVAVLLAALSLAVLGSFVAVRAMELDYFRIPLEMGQLALLAVSFLVLSVPFAIAGLVTALAYADPGIPAARTYVVAMVGSGLGAAAPIGLLPAFGVAGAVAAIAAVPAILGVVAAARSGSVGRSAQGGMAVGVVAAALAIGSLATGLIGEVRPSSYKLGYQALQFPETEVVERRTTIRGRYERLQGPALRFAPGLSLRWTERFPRQDALLTDGDASLFVPRDPDPRYAGELLGSVGAALVSDPRTALVLQASGGSALPIVVQAGVPRVTVVDASGWRAAAVRAAVAELGWDARVTVRRSSLRGFTARAGERYDLIYLDHAGASVPGVESLSRQFTLTVDALRSYLDLLTEDGVLVLGRKLSLPPSTSLRAAATAVAALAGRAEAPERHLAMLRSFESFVLAVSRKPLSDERRAAVRSFAEERGFDLVYLSDMSSDEANRFAVLVEPRYHVAIGELIAAYRDGRAGGWFRGQVLDVAPRRDGRPFFSHTLRWGRIGELAAALGGRWFGFLLSAEVVVAAVIGISALAAALLLALPAAAGRRDGRLSPAVFAYFLAVGAGYIWAELALIGLFTLLIGDPVVSVVVVLSGMLTLSGLGGLASARIGIGRLPVVLIVIGALLAVAALTAFPLVRWLLALPAVLRVAGSALLLAVVAVPLGLPFPAGMRLLAPQPYATARAWAANGAASVVGAALAPQLAWDLGIPALGVLAAAVYLGTALAARRAAVR